MLLEIIELVNYTYEPQQGILPIVVAGLVAQGVDILTVE